MVNNWQLFIIFLFQFSKLAFIVILLVVRSLATPVRNYEMEFIHHPEMIIVHYFGYSRVITISDPRSLITSLGTNQVHVPRELSFMYAGVIFHVLPPTNR